MLTIVPTIQVDELQQYEAVREQIRDADVVLFSGTDLGSRIIRAVTRSPYSHAGICAWWNGRLIVMEARIYGVRAARLSQVVKKYHGDVVLLTTREDVDVHENRRGEAVQLAKTQLGKDYSKRKLVRYLGRLLATALGRSWCRPAADDVKPEDFFCSEYVSYAWRKGAGFDLCPLEDEFTTPEDLANSPSLVLKGRLISKGKG